MAYRSPELYDVQTSTQLDEKMDIWVRMGHGSPKDAREKIRVGTCWLNNEYTNAWIVDRVWDVCFMQPLMVKVPLKQTCIK